MPETMLHPDVQKRLDLPYDRAFLLQEGPVTVASFGPVQPTLADICAQAALHGQHDVVTALLPVLVLADESTVGAVA
jgi:hypothetical protein